MNGMLTGNFNTDWSGVFDSGSVQTNADYSDDSSNGITNIKAANVATGKTDEKRLWNLLYEKIKNKFGVSGVMGNLFAESGLRTNNVQDSCEKRVGNDTTYTQNVDNGTYGSFSKDSVGYGLAQWTSSDRKAALLKVAREKQASISNEDVQTTHLWNELSKSYKDVATGLSNASSVKEASDLFMTKFERPKNQSESAKSKRASYAQSYYDKYSNDNTTSDDNTVVKPIRKTGGKNIAGGRGNSVLTHDNKKPINGGYGDAISIGMNNPLPKTTQIPKPSNSTSSDDLSHIVEYLTKILQVLGESSDKLNALSGLKDAMSNIGNTFNSNNFYSQTNNTSTDESQKTPVKTNMTKYRTAERIAFGGL